MMKAKLIIQFKPRLILFASLGFLTLFGSPTYSASQKQQSVIAWGSNNYGQTNVPAGLNDAVALKAGEYFSLALRSDGTVAAWGDNDHGQCAVPSGLSNVRAVAGGSIYALAQTRDGRIFAWGDDFAGLTTVPPDLTNVVAIDGGAFHALALKADGTVVSWGYSGDTFGYATNVPGNLSNVVAISGGGYHSLALKADGTVAAWGFNNRGQACVPAGLSNVLAISAGGFHSLALKADGTLAAWGGGASGVSNVGDFANIVAISAGEHHSLALSAAGTVITWGANIYSPPSNLSNVVAISAGGFHNLALAGDGSPAITVQPLARSVTAGDSLQFDVRAVGLQPMYFQWQVNGANLPGATNVTLILDDVRLDQAGHYSVLVSNTLGTASSRTARLVVASACLDSPKLSLRMDNMPASLVLEWPTNLHCFQLETADSLQALNWTPVLSTTTANGTNRATLDLTGTARFFRLRE